MSKLYKTGPLLLIAAALLLGGCKKVEEPSEAQVENSIPEGDDAVEPEAPALPKVDYWKPLAGYLAGDYSGQCMRITGTATARSKANIKLAADGAYTFNDHAGNLLKSSIATINRSRAEDGTMRVIFSSGEDDTAFSLTTGEAGKGSVVNFGKKDGDTFVCEPGTQPIALADKPLHVVFASFLEQSSQKIGCILSGDLTKTAVDLELKGGVLKVGKYTYELAKMNEMMTLQDGFSDMNYIATMGNDDMVSVSLDEFGKVAMVTRKTNEESMMMCSHKD